MKGGFTKHICYHNLPKANEERISNGSFFFASRLTLLNISEQAPPTNLENFAPIFFHPWRQPIPKTSWRDPWPPVWSRLCLPFRHIATTLRQPQTPVPARGGVGKGRKRKIVLLCFKTPIGFLNLVKDSFLFVPLRAVIMTKMFCLTQSRGDNKTAQLFRH